MAEPKSSSYSDRYTREEWLSLFEALKDNPQFKLKVKSAPGDDLRYVWIISSSEPGRHGHTDKIVFFMTEEKISVEFDFYETEGNDIKSIIQVLFEEPLDSMPLRINDKVPLVKTIANWRLRSGI